MATKVGVLGTGSWGTALAQVLLDNGCDVLLYGIDPAEIEDINSNHRNSKYFGDDPLSDAMRATNRAEELAEYSDVFVLATPTRAVSAIMDTTKSTFYQEDIETKFNFRQNDKLIQIRLFTLTDMPRIAIRRREYFSY